MFVESLFQVKQCGTEDTEVNRTGSSHEGAHSPAGELKQTKGRGEEREMGVRERRRRMESQGRDFSQLKVQEQLHKGRP